MIEICHFFTQKKSLFLCQFAVLVEIFYFSSDLFGYIFGSNFFTFVVDPHRTFITFVPFFNSQISALVPVEKLARVFGVDFDPHDEIAFGVFLLEDGLVVSGLAF